MGKTSVVREEGNDLEKMKLMEFHGITAWVSAGHFGLLRVWRPGSLVKMERSFVFLSLY